MTEKSLEHSWKTATVYQIFPDRFAIGKGESAQSKYQHGCYPFADQRVTFWKDLPRKQQGMPAQHTHWGGDISGISEKLEYIASLGFDTLYLTPIFQGVTNHKYDAIDYYRIDPGFGTLQDFQALCSKAHGMGMKIILDGVFNHASSRCLWMKEGKKDFFVVSRNGEWVGWENSGNLLELNLENPELQKILFLNEDSVLKYWLKQGADGWRLDCAHDLGPRFLSLITKEVKEHFPHAIVIGEAWNYPAPWKATAMDGIMNYIFHTIVYDFLKGFLSAQKTGTFLETMVKDLGQSPDQSLSVDYLSGCWNMSSSHDVERLSSVFEHEEQIRQVLLLQYTFPGTPMVYYGEERGMIGGKDPENRGTVDWDSPVLTPERLNFIIKLNQLRKEKAAFTQGEFFLLTASDDHILAFKRRTKKVDEQVVVLFNPTSHKIDTRVYLKDGWVFGGTEFVDLFTGETIKSFGERICIEIEPYGYRVFEPTIRYTSDRYTPYKRIDSACSKEVQQS